MDVLGSKQANSGYEQEIQSATIKRGKTKLFFFSATRPSGTAAGKNFIWDDSDTGGLNDGYKVKWFKGKKVNRKKDITSKTRGAGHPFTLAVEQTKYFTAKVTAKDNGSALCLVGRAEEQTFPYSDAAAFQINGVCV